MAEENITEDKRLRNMLHNLPGMAYRCSNDSNWTMDFVSEGCLELTGYRPEELIHNKELSFEEVIHFDDREKVRKEVEAAIEQKRVFELTYRLRTKGGVSKWVWEQGRLINSNEDGQTLEGFITDITPQKQAEKALMESRNRNEMILKKALSSIITIDADGLIESTNTSAESTFGYPADELNGIPIGKLLPVFRKYTPAEYISGFPDSREDIGIKKDSTEFAVDVSIGEVPLELRSVYTLIIRDISVTKKNESRLRHSEEKYRSLLEATSATVWTTGPDGGFDEYQESWEEYTGQPWEEHRGWGWAKMFFPADTERLKQEWAEAVQKKEKFVTYGRVFCAATEEYHYFEVRAVPIIREDGSVREWIGATIDIHERRLAEEKLKESEERYRSVVKASSSVVWITGPDGGAVSPQDSWEAYTGQPFEEHQGWGWAKMIHPDDFEVIENAWLDAIRDIKPFTSLGRIFSAATGDYRYVESQAVPVPNDDGSIREWVGTSTDIHERRLAEEKLKESEKRYALAFEASHDCLWDMDLINRKVEFNDAFKKQFADGVDPNFEDPLVWWSDRVHPADSEKILGQYRAASLDPAKRLWKCEYRFRTANGPFATVRACTLFERDDNGKPVRVIGTLEDISKRREIENAILCGSEDNYRRIGHDIHDDFCQQLFGIGCQAHSLQKKFRDAGLSKEADNVAVIEEMTRQLNQRARDMARGLAPFFPESEGLIGSLEQQFRWMQSVYNIQCDFQHGDPGPECHGDTVMQLYRISQEAIKNAIHHGKATKISVDLSSEGHNWTLTIRDNGTGLAKYPESDGMGMQTMKFRANTFGATIKMENRKSGGAKLTCVFSTDSPDDEQE
ncbi:MAG: PAS domain S-box protein [Verrucomicrobiales bacterium]|nr:PAS domain S-box protein [Verrucomicrobiales bacterium]